MGWICEETPEVALEPIPEVRSRLRCRGQVLESTKKVTYEIEIKEIGYGPEPYCIADALMYADGKPVVDMRDMSLKYTGVTRDMVEQLWVNQPTAAAPASTDTNLIPFAGGYYPRESAQGHSTPAKYSHAQILEFAEGEPWKCFGEPYKIFDGVNRKLARLPRPPFNFLHRVTDVTGKPFEMVAGGTAVGEYDVHADDWYFAQERTGRIPFTVLQEAALQVCGWLSSYVGSGLTSETDLAYRNLGGSCKWHRPMLAESKTLTTKVKLTQLSQSAGMVIQHFHMDMFDSSGPVYSGTTYFGFFDKESLKNQVGIRGFQPWEPSATDLQQSLPVMPYPTQAPLPDSTLQMIDKIVTWLPNGGPNGLGYVVGETPVKPGTWFFDAHFYQDPVVPGSLGLESFIQLMKAEAVRRWGHTGQFKSVGIPAGTDHEWIYRGQVVPTDRLMTTKMYVTKVDDTTRTLWADGHLEVDGRYIYQMKKFAVQLV
jgi:3-hydroxymyristoyl/3-hydroxydecanoyl-(acyl carrier protein) dehydratase